MEIKGTIIKIYEVKKISEKFSAQDFVIQTDEKYPQKITFQLSNDKMDLIRPYTEGSPVNVHFNLRGREWKDKYFNTLEAWKIDCETATKAPQQIADKNADSPF